jgi:tRNA-specific 2-thiouridylase
MACRDRIRAERDEATGRHLLLRGLDPSKDQSYFLSSLTQTQLTRAWFPVGGLSKETVRDIARRRTLPVADKPDSQEICFIPDHDYASFVAARTPDVARDGAIVDAAGRVLGSHGGIHRFTVGQRKGLGLSSPTGTPMYVLALHPAERQVVVGPKAALGRTTLTASGVNWILEQPRHPIRVAAQIRHRHRPAAGTVTALGEGCASLTFDEPQYAVTPGQALVFYDDDVVVGGGWIDSPE